MLEKVYEFRDHFNDIKLNEYGKSRKLSKTEVNEINLQKHITSKEELPSLDEINENENLSDEKSEDDEDETIKDNSLREYNSHSETVNNNTDDDIIFNEDEDLELLEESEPIEEPEENDDENEEDNDKEEEEENETELYTQPYKKIRKIKDSLNRLKRTRKQLYTVFYIYLDW